MKFKSVKKKVADAVMGKTTVNLIELYAYALKTSTEEFEKAMTTDEEVRKEAMKAMLGQKNNITKAFEEWRNGQQHAENERCEQTA